MNGWRFKQRRDLVNVYQVHSGKGVACTVNHFSKEGIARNSLYKILKSFQERNTTERKVGSGQKAEKLTPFADKEMSP